MRSSLRIASLASLALADVVLSQSFSINALPHTWQPGQSGYNDCGTTDSQSSGCQTAMMNSLDDFCLWAPPTPGQTIGNSERVEVAWCTKSGHGARLIPQGSITGAHWVDTPHYTQVTGIGHFTSLNIQAGDQGGELDPHGADGNGNPIGGLVYNNGVQIHEWTSFISDSEFCFRICKDAPDAWLYCQHVYDLQGCQWNEPGNYNAGFDVCEGDSTQYPGIYVQNGVTSTYAQGDGSTPAPPAHPAGATSNCQAIASIGGYIAPAPQQSTTSAASSSTPASTTPSSTSPSSSPSSTSSSSSSSSVSTTPSSTSSSSASSTFSTIPTATPTSQASTSKPLASVTSPVSAIATGGAVQLGAAAGSLAAAALVAIVWA